MQVTRHGLVSGPIAEWWAHKVDQLRHSPKPDKQDAQIPSDLSFAQSNRFGLRKDHLKGARPAPSSTIGPCNIFGVMGHWARDCWHNPKNKGKGKGKNKGPRPRPPVQQTPAQMPPNPNSKRSLQRFGGKGGKGGKGKPFRK